MSSTPTHLKFQCTYTTQIRKKRNRVYHDGTIHIHTPSRKITLYDTKNLVIDSKFFNEMDELKKLDGEELTFEKCFVDVLEELDYNTGEVKKKEAVAPAPVKKVKKRKAPLLRMTKPLTSVYEAPTNDHMNRAGSDDEAAPRRGARQSREPAPPRMDFKRASRKPLQMESDDEESDNDNMASVPHPSPPRRKLERRSPPATSLGKPERRSIPPHEAQSNRSSGSGGFVGVRSNDALLALFGDDNEETSKEIHTAPHHQPRQISAPKHQLPRKTLTNTKPKSLTAPKKHKSAFFADILEDEGTPAPVPMSDEEDDGVVMDASFEASESDDEDALASLIRKPSNADSSKSTIPNRPTAPQQVSRKLPPQQRKTAQPAASPAQQSQPPASFSPPIPTPPPDHDVMTDSEEFDLPPPQSSSKPPPPVQRPVQPRKLPPQRRIPQQNTAFDIVPSDEDSDDIIRLPKPSKKRKAIHQPAAYDSPSPPPSDAIAPAKKRRRIEDEGVVLAASSSDEEIPLTRIRKPSTSSNPKQGGFMPPEMARKSPPSQQRFAPPSQRNYTSPTTSTTTPRSTNSAREPLPAQNFKPPIASPQQVLQKSVLSVVQKECGTSLALHFPDADVLKQFPGGNFQRHCRIPDSFATVHEYTMTFLHALYEEMNLQLFQLAYKFRSHYNQITNENSTEAQAPLCKTCHQRTQVRSVKKQNENYGRLYYSCAKKGCQYFVSWVDQNKESKGQNSARISDREERRSFFRKHDIPFYHECQLLRSTKKDADNPQWFIVLGEKEKSSKYGMDDIWIISYSDEFTSKYGVLIARGLYHCPGTDGLLEIEIMRGNPRKASKTTGVFAIRGPNFSSELQMIENLNTMDPLQMPFINELLGHSQQEDPMEIPNAPSFPAQVDPEVIREKVDATIETHGLNEDQASVLRQCAKWFETGDTSDNIMLVHGAFGAGKSFLLTVLITFICDLCDEIGDEHVRILISSVTNVAVDNVLRGLVDLGFEDFLRIGSQQKIARDILPYTIASDKTKNAQIRELKQMLKEQMTDSETRGVKQRISDLKSGRQKDRESKVNKVRVVGVTCAASGFEVLKAATFPIIIQDESSQCLEPLALLPISRFKCQKLIAVGDPLQLPPTLVGATSTDEDSLEKTLFVRLANVGFKPLMLRTQYRCHPMISQISNAMFYGQSLQDGITEDEREPLIPYMPPVTLIDTFSGKEKFSGGSYSNESEAIVILHMIDIMTKKYGIDPDQIGVISLYKPQAYNIAEQLKKKSLRRIKVSTVDAFQGGEKDVVFLSCVRTSSNVNQFLESKKRLNVAITRAKRHLVIVGKQSLLQQSALWRTIIGQAKRMNGVYPTSQILTMEDLSVFEKNTILEKSANFSRVEDDDAIVEEDLNEVKATASEMSDDGEEIGEGRIQTRSATRSNAPAPSPQQTYRYNLPPLTAPAEIVLEQTSQTIVTVSDIRNKRKYFEAQSAQLASMSGSNTQPARNLTSEFAQRTPPPQQNMSFSSNRSSLSANSASPSSAPQPSPNLSTTSSTNKKTTKRIINFDDDDDAGLPKNFTRLIEDDDSDEDLLDF